MSRWRILTVLLLLLVPFAILAGYGCYGLWKDYWWGAWVWIPMTLAMALAWFLAWYWQRNKTLLQPVNFEPNVRWTERDQQAWKLVQARASAAKDVSAEKLVDPQLYLKVAQEMGLEMAAFYHPKAKDPYGNLTVPEVLAVVELVSHDMAEMVDKYLPGGHLLTINNWRTAGKAVSWYQSASNLYWVVSALISPVNTGLRYAATQLGMTTPLQMLQENLLLWFYTAFLQRLGTYLIELNSGRLSVGATRYRQLVEAASGAKTDGDGDGETAVRQVTVTLMGQVKAGKSSMVNALLGENRARTDVLPATDEITRYEFQPPDVPTKLVLQDTVGYGHEGPRADQIRATQQAAQGSDLLLLVVHAVNPARQADVEMFKAVHAWFVSHPDLKRPPIVVVATHIDLLKPSLEWSPPYDWRRGKRPKEENIRQAVAAIEQQLGDLKPVVIPVCAAPGKVYGVDEFLLPAVMQKLDEAHGVAFLRCLRAEKDAGKIRKVFRQMLEAGKAGAQIVWQNIGQTASK
ncbi:MAG TPA: GTPase [Gemmataceae bacterium]|nr:GTPase [Gemmataceae bacterium]